MLVLVGVSTLVGLAAFVATVIELRTSKSAHEALQDGVEVPVPASLMAMYKRALEDLKVSDADAAKIDVFMTSEEVTQGWGSTTIFGVRPLLGLATSLEDDESLSDEAKLFIIAREVWRMVIADLYVVGCVTVSSLAAVFGVLVHKYAKLMMSQAKASRTMVTANRVVIVALIFYTCCKFKKTVVAFIDDEVDKAMCELGGEYVRGATEFYTKLAEREERAGSYAGTFFKPRGRTTEERLKIYESKVSRRGVQYAVE